MIVKYIKYSEACLNQSNICGINLCVQNRQVFCLYRLNKRRFHTLGPYLKLVVNLWILFYSGFSQPIALPPSLNAPNPPPFFTFFAALKSFF
jgi:hypothetical protein